MSDTIRNSKLQSIAVCSSKITNWLTRDSVPRDQSDELAIRGIDRFAIESVLS